MAINIRQDLMEATTLHPSNGLVRSFESLIGGRRQFKVEMTSDPQDCAKRHENEGWEEMVLLFRTPVWDRAEEAEWRLIREGWKVAPGFSLNERAPRRTRPRVRSGYYCVYLLLTSRNLSAGRPWKR